MDWLKNLKAGDEVKGGGSSYLSVICNSELTEPLPQKIEEINRRDHKQNLINTIKDYDLLEARVEALEKIVKIIKEEQCEV